MKDTFRQFLLGLVMLSVGCGVAVASDSEWDLSGNTSLQLRGFSQNALWPEQNSSDAEVSVSGEWEVRWRSEEGDQRASFIPFARWDENDDERTHMDLREGYWAYEGTAYEGTAYEGVDFEFLVGVNKVFWGVTESVHLVDIINQTDLVEDIDQEDKLGQPMVNLALQQDWGLLNIYLLPYFRERTFPGQDGRFRAPLPVDWDDAEYESGAEEKHMDLALRYSHYFGDVDVGVYYFRGTNREPRLEVSSNGQRLTPFYDQIDQLGVDVQYTKDAWLWKLETIVRDGYDESFMAAVGGFEYTFYQVYESNADIGFLMEYQYDDRSSKEPITIADNDLFVGGRWSLNDTQDTALLAGVVVDDETSETFFNIEAERRFGDSVVVELRVRAITNAESDEPLYSFSQDDYIQLQISRFF
ncbi:MAG: hypothetical protein QNK32_03815 [Porticoccus sp.]|nr:hypothetical protein [Porticoccus sp.]